MTRYTKDQRRLLKEQASKHAAEVKAHDARVKWEKTKATLRAKGFAVPEPEVPRSLMEFLSPGQREAWEKDLLSLDARKRILVEYRRKKAPPPTSLYAMSNMVSCCSDPSLTRRIIGVASTPTIDNYNTSLLSRGCVLRVPIPLLWSHDQKCSPIGQVDYMYKTETQVTIQAAIFNNVTGNFAWEMFARGELDGLSCGIEDMHLLDTIDGVKFFDRWRIREISVVRSPANSDCSFRFYDRANEE